MSPPAVAVADARLPPPHDIVARFLASRVVAVTVIVLGILVIWYIGAFVLNAPFQRDLDRRVAVTRTATEFVVATYSQPKPTLPAPHQVALDAYKTVVL